MTDDQRLKQLLDLRTRVDHEIHILQRRTQARRMSTTRWTNVELVPCGTETAYARHRRRGETPCPACKAARAAGERDREARRQARTVA